MTREEAIAELNKAMDEISLGSYTYDGLERSIALEIGIKALEQEYCEDCISREQALKCFTWTNTKDDVFYSIKALPPVTPKPKTDVFDKIRAEIEQEYNRLSATRADETLELGECLGLKMALKIIDKYTVGKE